MIPAMRLNVSPVTTSHPPHSTAAARSAIGRAAPVASHQSSAPSASSAAGSSHDTWPPISAPNSRVSPV